MKNSKNVKKYQAKFICSVYSSLKDRKKGNGWSGLVWASHGTGDNLLFFCTDLKLPRADNILFLIPASRELVNQHVLRECMMLANSTSFMTDQRKCNLEISSYF